VCTSYTLQIFGALARWKVAVAPRAAAPSFPHDHRPGSSSLRSPATAPGPVAPAPASTLVPASVPASTAAVAKDVTTAAKQTPVKLQPGAGSQHAGSSLLHLNEPHEGSSTLPNAHSNPHALPAAPTSSQLTQTTPYSPHVAPPGDEQGELLAQPFSDEWWWGVEQEQQQQEQQERAEVQQEVHRERMLAEDRERQQVCAHVCVQVCAHV